MDGSKCGVGICFGGALVAASLVQMSLMHSNGCGGILSDELGCEFWPCGEVAGVDGGAPCGKGWGEAACVVVRDAFFDGGVWSEGTVDVL